VQLYVLDKHMQPAPLGTAGELYIGGESLARGYLNRPELTAEKFGPNPYSDEPGARLYRTGDLARYLPDGNIEFIGRVDNQVKLRGYRIELEEIEVALQQHPAVGQAVVMARQDGPGEKRLVAYIVAAQDMSPSVTELRNYLKQKLPDYMVPAAFVLLDVLPLTPNGKLDRRALTVSDSAGVELRSAFIEPRNELESRLAQIWETILNTRPIGVRDNFWDLGGHSLAGTRLLNEIRQTFNCDLPISILFQELTVEQLAKILCPEETVTVASPFMALQPHGSRPPFFIGGSNPRLTNLARYLGLDQPSYKLDVYALQEECLQTGREPYTQIDAIATHFIEKIRAVQPVGPYFLGGGCEGGYVAYEVARQLQRQGESIAMLLLWEVPPTPFSRKKPFYPAYYLAHQLRSLVRHGPKKLMTKLLAKARRGNNSHPLSAEASRFQWLQSANHQALQNYKPQKYSGPIILFRAHDQPPGTYDPTVGWDELVTGEIEIHILPGNHTTYTALHFLDFAERLKTCLDKAHSAALVSRGV
jgi:thioesterase domain-containing protein